MEIKNWKYYNHAMLPTTAPHEEADITAINDKSIWKHDKKPILARWTSDFDCGYETNWWYVIKDEPFDISTLKAKRRYEINKGINNFDVKIINPTEYKEEIYNVQVEAFKAYPKKYRPTVDKEKFFLDIDTAWIDPSRVIYGAFYKETGVLSGYAYLNKTGKYINLPVQKTIPEYEKYNVNAALIYNILIDMENDLRNGCYICDGERNVSHETKFQDYLEKYFVFRKSYCKLNIEYNPRIKWIIKLMYPFRKILNKFDSIGLIHNINSILKMEEICYR